MAARLRFAIAAAKSHDVLLIDEALATGDGKFRRRSEERVQELRAGAGTVFLVSHQLSTVRGACERTIWLESGVIRLDGPTDEVVDAYEEFTKEGSSRAAAPNASDRASTATAVAESGRTSEERHMPGTHRAEPGGA
jgi:ABC-type polysaccharide/polyol phosphate transport system ATPase subunit